MVLTVELRNKHNIKNKDDFSSIDDPCSILREIYLSDNMSIAHVNVVAESKKHIHRKMEEVYYVTKGKGQVFLGADKIDIKEGDVIPIPKNVWHYLIPSGKFELLAITYPKYDSSDMIFPE